MLASVLRTQILTLKYPAIDHQNEQKHGLTPKVVFAIFTCVRLAYKREQVKRKFCALVVRQ
jgi:hypothetical protein